MTMRYANPAHTMIDAGDGRFIPCDPENADYAALLADGEEIGDYVPDLVALRAEAVARVEGAVSAARTKYAAAPAHQELVYNMKLSEAQAYVEAGRPADASPYVVLSASAEGSGRTVSAEADLVLAKAEAWTQIAASTERLRIAGAAAIAAADTVEAITAARDAHVAQLLSL